MSKQKVKDRVSELAEEYGVSRQVVWALYDIMPNELYDGIPDALENIDSLSNRRKP